MSRKAAGRRRNVGNAVMMVRLSIFFLSLPSYYLTERRECGDDGSLVHILFIVTFLLFYTQYRLKYHAAKLFFFVQTTSFKFI